MTTSATIGPEGGTLAVPGATAHFPEYALAAPLDVGFTVGPTGVDSIAVILSARGSGPTDLSAPVTVTLRFAECAGEHIAAPGASMTETTDGVSSDSTATTAVDEAPPTSQEVVLSLQSFSWYIIAH